MTMTDITAAGFKGGKTAVALGFFDGLHLGHTQVIVQALLQELTPIVFTFSGRSVLPKFSRREDIIDHDLKLELLERIGVKHIYAPDFADVKDMTAEQFVQEILAERLNAGFVSCGYDFHFAKGGKADADTLRELCGKRGIKVCVVPAVKIGGETVSSTRIRELIKSGDTEKANLLLGYELTYCREVIHGKENGKKMGFPTINQTIPEGMTLPKFGVYKSRTKIGDTEYPSVTNIGVKPTIDLDEGEVRRPLMETHIIGFEGDLYGRRISVSLLSYIRDERKFSGLQELSEQLEKDKRSAICSPKNLSGR